MVVEHRPVPGPQPSHYRLESDGDYPEGEEDRPQRMEGASSEAEGIVLGDGNSDDDGEDDEDDGPPGLMPKQIT